MSTPEKSAAPPKARTDLRLLRRALKFVRPYRRQLGAVYLFYFLNSVLNLIPAASLAWYIDGVVRGGTFTFFGRAFGTYAGASDPREAWWSIPAAWRIKVEDGRVAELQIYADNKPVYEILATR